ncbi:MAG: DUF1427 family protein [Nitrospinota bacterium]
MMGAFATGVGIGVIFTLLHLPAPVPRAFAGVLGIVGMWVGFALVILVRDRWLR